MLRGYQYQRDSVGGDSESSAAGLVDREDREEDLSEANEEASASSAGDEAHLQAEVNSLIENVAAEKDADFSDAATRESKALLAAAELVQQGHYASARRILMTMASDSRENPGLCLALARVNEAMEKWADAAVWYAAADEAAFATGIAETGPRWRRQRARCHYRSGEYRPACDAWGMCLEPGDRTLSMGELIEYADSCMRIDDYETAQSLLDQVSARSSGRLKDVEILRATCALRRGDLELAEVAVQAALDEWTSETRFQRLAELIEAARSAGNTASSSPADSEAAGDSLETGGEETTSSLPTIDDPSTGEPPPENDFPADE